MNNFVKTIFRHAQPDNYFRRGRRTNRAVETQSLEPRLVLSATISGYKFLDTNCDGIRNTDLVQGNNPDIVFVVDVSSSTAVGPGAIFVGSPVGDFNADGVSNTILDAELSGFAALNEQLLLQGLGTDADVGIVLFGGNAVQLDMSSVAGTQLTIPAGQDLNSNSIPDVVELLQQIRHGGQGISSGVNGATTNYEAALQQTINFFNTVGTAPGSGNMIFLTDGRPNDPSNSTAVYADEVATLNSLQVNMNAFGAGGTSAVPPLQVIDPGAVRFDSTDELLQVFGGLQGSKTVFREPGLAGVKIWLDIDRDGVLDADEPFTFSAADDPNTTIDETGNYQFTGLPDGTYDVREDIPTGMIQTAPVGGFTTVNATNNGSYRVYFGNRPGEISGTKWADLNGNGIRDRLLVGDQPDVVFVVDISGSTRDEFSGTVNVGDVNGDGLLNTVLDAEIAGFIALNQTMINSGFGATGTVSLIAFESLAVNIDLDPVAPGLQISTNPLADRDSNGVRDVEQALRVLVDAGSTDYESALSLALTVFNTLATPSDQANLIFLSDGAPNVPGGHTDEVAALRAAGYTNLRAFGAGQGASLTELQIIDTAAQIFNSPDELIALFGGVQAGSGGTGGFTEPGLAGVTIYLDVNNNGTLDVGEPQTVTATDNPATPANELGTYTFTGLSAGSYTVREIPPAGQYPTYPIDGTHFVTLDFGSYACALEVDFGNAPPGCIEGFTWYDDNENGLFDSGDSTLSGMLVYLDDNNNGVRDGDETYVLTDRFGYYKFETVAPGYHTVREELPANCPWVQTSPYTGSYFVFVSGGQCITDINFGSYLTDFAWVVNDTIFICGIDTDDLIGIYQTPGLVSIQVNHFSYQFSTVGINVIIAYGQGGNDVISAQGGYVNVFMRGGWGDDNLTGTWGTEVLEGGDGNDVLAGGPGGDIYQFSGIGDIGEVDIIVEYEEVFLPAFASQLIAQSDDILDFQGSWTGVTVDLSSQNQLASQGNRRIESAPGSLPQIESVIGSRLNDTLQGNALYNTIDGLEGSDLMIGAGGDDILRGGSGADYYLFDADLPLGSDTIEELSGEGRDGISFAYTTSQSVSIDLALAAAQIVNSNLTLTLGTGGNIEDAIGGAQNDILNGNAKANFLYGGGGNDIIKGRGGNDTLVGDVGDDTYVFGTNGALGTDKIIENPGQGIDTLDFSLTTTRAVTANLSLTTTQTVNAGLKLQLSDGTAIENVIGGSLGDTISGNSRPNVIEGGGGNDTLNGAAGNDVYVFDTDFALGTDTINETGGGNDTLDFSKTTTRAVSVNLSTAVSQTVNAGLKLILGSATTVENVIGGSQGDTITGNTLANRLTGGAGNDSLNGGAGNDTYIFDADDDLGNDTVIDSAGIDWLDFSATTTRAVAVDLGLTTPQVVHATGLSLTLSTANSIENVSGGALNDSIRGNSAGNRLVGNAGNDILEGFGGNDVLIGGLGNDTYRFDTDLALGTDTLDESGGGVDTLNFGATTTRAVSINLANAASQIINAGLTLVLGAGNTVENVVGGSLGDTITGNSLDNRINGNAGNDVLNGGDGNDVYVFDTDIALGNDTITETAGGGIDTLDFSLTTTRNVTINLATTTPQVVNAGLTLTLSANNTFENVIGGAKDDVITGNSANNILVGGAGNDTLSGGNGRDVMIGGTGGDTVNGGIGDDLLIGGTTNFDSDISSLTLIMAEWSRTDQTYAQRIAHLKTASGGKNGAILLKAGTVQNDAGAADQVTGGNDLDWFFSSLNDNLIDYNLASEVKSAI